MRLKETHVVEEFADADGIDVKPEPLGQGNHAASLA